jgi:leader peptidase (prepilin peptidase)/N-methyltransferase
MLSKYLLVLLCLYLTVHDLRYRKVPNWITLPLILIGIVVNFPGAPTLWLGSILLLTAWGSGWMGGGDVKLWIGLLWCTFSFWGDSVILVMFLTLIVTAIAQILVRILAKKREVAGIKLPGAWRALAYLIFLVLHHAGWLNYVNI